MPLSERIAVIENLSMVDEVITFDDTDGTACDAIRKVQRRTEETIIFANGGDRKEGNVPEEQMKDVDFYYGIGGFNKMNSSSWILNEWKSPKTERPWGYYRILHDVPGCKVKELTVEPGQSLSMQKHNHRSEYWLVTHGSCVVNSVTEGGYNRPPTLLNEHMEYRVPIKDWHQLTNPYEIPCRIVEIQYGDKCEEEDIERK